MYNDYRQEQGRSNMNTILHFVPILAQVGDPLNQTVTVTFNLDQVITSIIVGLIAGVLASVLVRGRRFGFIGSVILGVLGAVVGGFIFSLFNFNISPTSPLAGGITIRLIDILVAFVGALILLIIFVALFGRRNL
jgi:uncharacterized membrane protein YeaQ/YmgE (transglycosylase-associated protein family)